MDFLKNLCLLIGRVGIGALIIWLGIAKILQWNQTESYIKAKNIPSSGTILLVAILIQICGGLAVLLGFEVHFASALLILYSIPAAWIFHDFWRHEGEKKLLERGYFMRDMAILAGLFFLLAFGGGAFSV